MRSNLVKYAPPGYDYSIDKKFYFIGLSIATMYSFSYSIRFTNEKNDLYRYYNFNIKELIPGAVMPDFVDILGNALWGYFILAACLLTLIALRYASYYQHSKSIYLMKRLPNKLDIHRRCLVVPILAAVSCFAIAFLVLLLYFGHYMIFTPNECLTPNQWAKIWR